MATYTIYAGSGGRVYDVHGIYSTSRSGGGTLTANAAGGNSLCTVGQLLFSPDYYLYEAYAAFDTSSVLGTVSSATLSMYCRSAAGATNPFSVYARAYDWGSSLTTADWVAGASASANALRATSPSTSSMSAGAYYDFTSDGSFISNVTSPVRLILTSSRFESGTAPTVDGLGTPAADERVYFDDFGGGNPPKLTIVTDYVAKSPVNSRRRPSGLYIR